MIQGIISHYESDPTVAVTYLYFDFNWLDQRQTVKLICPLISQLPGQCGYLPESLQPACFKSQKRQTQLTSKDLTVFSRQILKDLTGHNLLDALDECTDQEDLLKFIKALLDWNDDNLHTLATIRIENDIATSLELFITCQLYIETALVDADIRVDILERLSSNTRLNKWPVYVQKEIEDTLVRVAEGSKCSFIFESPTKRTHYLRKVSVGGMPVRLSAEMPQTRHATENAERSFKNTRRYVRTDILQD